jgi:uncharacterized SAM-binding protein YcdF (DUF218 family)
MPDHSPGEEEEPPGRRAGWLRIAVPAFLVAAVALAIGFLAFANSLPRAEVQLNGSADGIVVLTGGASRIVDAVELLAAGRGKRLLISGVNPSTTRSELIRKNPEFERALVKRIDLGRDATNTIGNAMETGNWVRSNKFQSLVVVTSGWHMPRALIEIAHELPDVRLVPYPVISDRMRDEPWWSDTATIRLLAVEYVKYLATFARVRFNPASFAGNERPRQS